METITVYRSGGLTPYAEIRNSNAEKFDTVAESATGKNPNRCSSVYASLDLREVENLWAEYRSYDRQLDGTIYKIVIPAKFLNENIYAYSLESYDEFWQCESSEDDTYSDYSSEPEEHARDYIATRSHIADWEYELLPLSHSELRDYEVLIPHHLATQCEWSVLTEADREEWEARTASYREIASY